MERTGPRTKKTTAAPALVPSDDFDKQLDSGKVQPSMETPAPQSVLGQANLPKSHEQKLADIFIHYFGSDPEKRIEIIPVDQVKIGTWRQIRKDGVMKIRKSIQTRGVLPLSFWCVMKCEDGTYLAIDCNHRLCAFRAEGIPNAKALVFPTLSQAEYKMIAGVCNEIHDSGTVHVTDWNKFYVLCNMLESGEYTKGKVVDFSKLENDLVS